MASRNDKATPHPPLLSSVVVGPSDSGGGSGGGSGATRRDYGVREVRRDASPYARPERRFDDRGYRTRALSGSPVHRSNVDHRHSSQLNHSPDTNYSHGFGSGRDSVRSTGRYHSPRGRASSGRSFGRGFDGPISYKGEGSRRNNPNVRRREGDWFCSDPLCGNLNFARRESCNSCRRPRHEPRRSYGGAPPPAVAPPPPGGTYHHHLGPPIMGRSPVRFTGSYYRSSPPPAFSRDPHLNPPPRDLGPLGPSPPPSRYVTRMPPLNHQHHLSSDRLDYLEDGYRDRGKYAANPRSHPLDWATPPRGMDHVGGRDSFMYGERKGYNERRMPSPLAPPMTAQRGRRMEREVRERSRSPIRGGPPPTLRRDFHNHRGSYIDQGRDDRRGAGRDRIGRVY